MEARFLEVGAETARSSPTSAPAEPERRAAPRRCSSAPGGTRTWPAGPTRTRCPTCPSATSTGSTSSSTCARGQTRWVRAPVAALPARPPRASGAPGSRAARATAQAGCWWRCLRMQRRWPRASSSTAAARAAARRCRAPACTACSRRWHSSSASRAGVPRAMERPRRAPTCALSARQSAGLLLCGPPGAVGPGAPAQPQPECWCSLFPEAARPAAPQAQGRRGGAALPGPAPYGGGRGVCQPRRRRGGGHAGPCARAGPQPPGAGSPRVPQAACAAAAGEPARRW